MTVHHGECGHIKLHWDNHNKCIKCSHCSRESTCSTCSSWLDSTWKLSEKRRTYTSRKWVMSKKRKSSQAMSDSSDEKKRKKKLEHYPTWPCCPGEDPLRWQLQGFMYPWVSPAVTGQPATCHWPSGQEDITDRPRTVTDHQSRVAGHQSLELENFITGESQYSPATGQPATGHQSSDFISTYN